jgi:hypothetical protein
LRKGKPTRSRQQYADEHTTSWSPRSCSSFFPPNPLGQTPAPEPQPHSGDANLKLVASSGGNGYPARIKCQQPITESFLKPYPARQKAVLLKSRNLDSFIKTDIRDFAHELAGVALVYLCKNSRESAACPPSPSGSGRNGTVVSAIPSRCLPLVVVQALLSVQYVVAPGPRAARFSAHDSAIPD